MSANYNTTQYSTVADAANALTAPFISPTNGTENKYSYSLDTASQINTQFGISDDVWALGGPVVGYTLPNGPYNAATDCSGFIARLLSCVRVAGGQSLYANLVMVNNKLVNFATAAHPQPFPSAKDYADFFAGVDNGMNRTNSFWQSIAFQSSNASGGSMANAQPGDILAYSLPPGNTDTGHVMNINSVQELTYGVQSKLWPTNLSEFTANNRFFAVTVYDSSGVEHYQDTRGLTSTGIGRGTVLVITDLKGIPMAFQFNGHDVLLYVKTIQTTTTNISPLGTLAVGRGIPH